jgi:hypothetical protein
MQSFKLLICEKCFWARSSVWKERLPSEQYGLEGRTLRRSWVQIPSGPPLFIYCFSLLLRPFQKKVYIFKQFCVIN